MSYIIYRTTNKINGKYYVGASNGNNTSYLGSGTLLKQAIKKYGRKNFIFEVLETFNTEDEMFDREAEIVNEIFVSDRNTYNMKLGGRGGKGSKKSANHKRKISNARKLQINVSGGRPPAMPFEETLAVYNEYGIRKGAEILGLHSEAFKSRVILAKKKLTSK